MFGEADEEVGIQIDSCDGPRVIINNDWQGRAICDFCEVVVDCFFVHQTSEVAGGKKEHVIAASFLGFFDQRDGSTDGTLARSYDYGNLCEAGGVKCFAGGDCDGNLFGGGEVNCFTVGAHCNEADETGFHKTNGMSFDGGNVKVFGFRVKEGHCRGVDSRQEGSAGVRMAIGAVGAVDMSVGSRHLGSCYPAERKMKSRNENK